MDQTASERINIRTTPHAKSVIEQACQLSGVSMSNFVISLAYDKAIDLLERKQSIVLSAEEWDNAVKQLESPQPVNDDMRALLARGKTLANR